MKIIQSNRYYSSVDWFKFLNGDYEIILEVIPNYDINYLVSTIIHEIRHMIDFTDENLNASLSSFDMDKDLRKYTFDEFFILVYISLEHELVARNNQIYPYIKFKNLTKEESLNILKGSFIWEALDMLKSFDYNSFINKYNEEELIKITNDFIKNCLHDDESTIDNKIELISFYKIWDEYFVGISKKWKDILLKEVDVIYERRIVNIAHCFKSYKLVLNEIWINISDQQKMNLI